MSQQHESSICSEVFLALPWSSVTCETCHFVSILLLWHYSYTLVSVVRLRCSSRLWLAVCVAVQRHSLPLKESHVFLSELSAGAVAISHPASALKLRALIEACSELMWSQQQNAPSLGLELGEEKGTELGLGWRKLQKSHVQWKGWWSFFRSCEDWAAFPAVLPFVCGGIGYLANISSTDMTLCCLFFNVMQSDFRTIARGIGNTFPPFLKPV